MAANRYGQIWHGDHHHINIRFPSNEARLKFQSEFEAYHASHDHDGDIPIFKCVTTKDLKLSTGDRSPQDLVKAESDKDYRITIDGYSWNEIHDYHNPSGYRDYSWYRVPTCCVPPTIVIDREFVDSGTLQRHPLSAIFGDMPADDFQSLIHSVQRDGFIEPVIRIYEGKILDGWHRYRAAKELNLIRKLKFQEWDERKHEDGDPKAFVLARNIERRHLNPSQRAQIAVAFNERFGHGTNRFTVESPNGDSKTRTELAKQAGVGTSTIDRAVQVEKAGQSAEVISGEKTAGEVLGEQQAKSDNEWEASIAVVKPRFLQAVEKWRSSHVERLQKFERLPVGRTPLLESEYIKTYFELADPRIPQNTKPTAAHYEGAIECMRDRPVAFAEQLEGRHYRRIIKDWDESVLPQLIKRFQGPLLGYSTSQLKAEAFEVRIKRAIRRQYEFQGRIPSQPFEVLFEITEDAHAVLIQLNPKEWVRDGREISWAVSVLPEPIDTPAEAEEIAGEKTAGEAVSEETVKGLWGLVTAEMKAWKARDKEKCRFSSDHIGKASKSMLITALRKYEESDEEGAATAKELRDLLRLMKTDSFAFILTVRTILKDSSDEVPLGKHPSRGEVLSPVQEARKVTTSAESGEVTDKEKAKKAASAEQAPAEEVSPMDPVWDAFNKRYPKWKAWYAESGYEENEFIQASTESELLDALRVYRESDREGMPTADEVKDMTNLMKQQSYPLAVYLRNLLRERGVSDTLAPSADEDEAEQDPFHDVDLEAVKADLETLLKKVMPVEKHPLWHQICENINDAYLDYENLPNDREIFAILLDCALTAIDELT
ncbi:MAG: ParB/RepB/Spo0J family partition protein [Candidatus Poribacteria bacterium]|nr:ParB/RepB/Spo0J family partition protein [Candidatus Poribacteria bacterium]